MANGIFNGAFNRNRGPAQGQVAGRIKREYRYYRALLDDPRTPTTARWLIGGGISYLMLPFDLIPDFIPIIGKLDDMLIAPGLIGLGMKFVPENVKIEDRSRSRRIRRIYDEGSAGTVLFESSALPGPFGIQIDTRGRDADLDGPVLFPLLDLMYEYGLVAVKNERPADDRFDDNATETTASGCDRRCSTQAQLDINFRPLPLVAAVMNYDSTAEGSDRFINSGAAFAELPPALKRALRQIRVDWRPCNQICVNAVLRSDEPSSAADEDTIDVPGAQFLNLLVTDECNATIDMRGSDASADELLAALREHMMNERFCYGHSPSAGDLVAWNPRLILRIPSEKSSNKPQYVYPRDIDGTLLGH